MMGKKYNGKDGDQAGVGFFVGLVLVAMFFYALAESPTFGFLLGVLVFGLIGYNIYKNL